jgi:hypothetical protein
MTFLKVNGIEIPVSSTAGATIERVRQGEYGRTATHAARSFVNASSDSRKATTTLAVNADALVYERAIRGLGHVWGFDNTLSSSKGLGRTGAAPAGQGYASGLVAGNALSLAPGTTLQYLHPYGGEAWTIACWMDDSGGGAYHYTFTSTGLSYGNGVLSASVGDNHVSEDGTTIDLYGGAGDFVVFDELVVLPYVVPATWPAWVYALGLAGTPLPPLSYVLAEGDWYGAATQVLGEVGTGRTAQWTDSGTLKTGEAFEFTLHRREGA